jgi:hypothetical protein
MGRQGMGNVSGGQGNSPGGGRLDDDAQASPCRREVLVTSRSDLRSSLGEPLAFGLSIAFGDLRVASGALLVRADARVCFFMGVSGWRGNALA